MSGLRVIEPGMLALVQDFGRFGWLAQGYSRGGPVDEHAFLWANRLLGNHFNAAQIEITLGGFSATAQASMKITVTGADVPVSVNGNSVPNWQVLQVNEGDKLAIGYARSGLRAYLAVAGGWQVTPVKGSCATVRREQIGGLTGHGHALVAGDSLTPEAVNNSSQAVTGQRVKPDFIPDYTSKLVLDVMPAAQFQQFAASAREVFFSETYQVIDKADRMGVRMKGAAVNWQGAGLVSEPLPIGAIQVPSDGQPIIMLNDRQTLGGYPKLGVLSWTAKNRLAQATPGSKIQFKEADAKPLQEQLKQVYRFFSVACQQAQNLRS
ncbi:allophanate hydrolase [Pseudidiomarina planktonica]|uniref:Allophanate hydrolase n=1 Tax=Pseudidiomarina planktonica TaxID=1323738 RepID=A0A1Y6EU79_9GAMM|nr:biotin-dependent carboxyltransferase family protein [Pseudidiomarina planktonica]RUO65189.1 allophanate hydrolase [Pseudidiomarina planktonica]SMQ66107.1 allophanate hydrolase [Pseudidiomarina planktonica]